MADRVHPTEDSPPTTTPQSQAEALKLEEKHLINNPLYNPAPTPPPARSVSILIPPGETSAPPGTYIVQLPKDQILRLPPPPSRLPYQGRKSRRPKSCCCRCCLCLLITLLLLIFLAAVFAGVFYFVYKPKAPKYSIDKLSIQGFNVTSPSSTVSPRMDVTVRAHNPNTKIGIYYAKGSSIQVSHSGIGELCTGALPVFYQPTNNVTLFQTVLRSTDTVMLQAQEYKTLVDEEKKKQIPLNMNMEVPVKIKFGSVKSWTILFKIRCRITVTSLTKDSSIVDKDCSVKFRPWE